MKAVLIMSENWTIVIKNYDKFWILKKSSHSATYCIMRKPCNEVGVGEVIRYFTVANPEDADDVGCKIASQHGLI